MNEVAEPYIRRRAVRHLEKGRVAIFVAGHRQPVLHDRHRGRPAGRRDRRPGPAQGDEGRRRLRRGSADEPDAERYAQLQYADLLRDQLKVLDAAAVSLCMENDLPIVVFDLNKPDNITRVAVGEPVGTLISGATSAVGGARDEQRDPGRRRAEDGPRRRGDGARLPGRPDRPRLDVARRAAARSTTTGPRRRSTSWPGSAFRKPHQIVIQPWDRGVLGAIEKAIQKSDIGLVPNVDGTVVRLNIPPLTEERRKDLVRVVHKRMEEARVEIRNIRRDVADDLKKEERDGDVGADEARPPARGAPEDDRPVRRRGRSARRRQGTGGPRGLVARSPLARPTDAPPRAHVVDQAEPTVPAAAEEGDALDRSGRPAAPRRDHHGRQPALGPAPRPRRARGPRRRRRGDPDAPPPRRPPRRPGHDALRLQPRELGPLRRRGPRPVRAPRAGDPQRDRGAPGAGRPDPAPRPARRAARRHAPLDRRGARRDRRRRPAPPERRVQLRRPDGARRRVPPARRERHRTRTRSTRTRSPRRSTPPACRTRTS